MTDTPDRALLLHIARLLISVQRMQPFMGITDPDREKLERLLVLVSSTCVHGISLAEPCEQCAEKPAEPRGCPTPGACSAVATIAAKDAEIERLNSLLDCVVKESIQRRELLEAAEAERDALQRRNDQHVIAYDELARRHATVSSPIVDERNTDWD